MPIPLRFEEVRNWCTKRRVVLREDRFAAMPKPLAGCIVVRFPQTVGRLAALFRAITHNSGGDNNGFEGGMFFVRETGVADEFYDDACLHLMQKAYGFTFGEHDGIELTDQDEPTLFLMLLMSAASSWNSWFVSESGSLAAFFDDDDFVCIVPRTDQLRNSLLGALDSWHPEERDSSFMPGGVK
jgi:hypothetical protein